MHLPNKPLFLSLISILLPCLLGGLATEALGIDYTWTGKDPNKSPDWTNPKNWSPSSVPDNSSSSQEDTVTFPVTSGNNQVDLADGNSIAVSGLSFQSPYRFTNNGDFTLSSSDHSGIRFQGSSAQASRITNNLNFYFSNTSTAGGAHITNNGDLNFKNSSDAGTSNITNNNVLSFNDDSKASNATLINQDNGILNFSNSADAGSAQITNSHTVNFNNSANANQAIIQNTGSLYFKDTVTANQATVINKGGTVDVSGITGTAPALSMGSLSDGNTTDSPVLSGKVILGNTALSLGGLGLDDTLSSVISGNGSLTKIGGGTLTLKRENTYLGTTTIQTGNLVVDKGATLGDGAVTIQPGATLSGFSPLASLNNAGTFALGDTKTIAAVAINGNFISEKGSTYQVKIDEAGNDEAGNNDRLTIDGTANLGGTLSVSFLNSTNGPYQKNTSYTLLSAGLLSGQFENFIQPEALNGELIYDYGKKQVRYQFDSLSSTLADSLSTPNQVRMAHYLLSLDEIDRVPSGILNELLQLASHQAIETYLDQLSGATYANQQLAVAEASHCFDGHLRDQIQTSHPKEALTPWLVARKSKATLFSAQVGPFQNSPDELAYGVETASQGSLFGMGLGYTHLNGQSVDSHEQSQARGNLYQLGTYGHQAVGDYLFGATFSLGALDKMNTQRWVKQGNDASMLQGHYHGSLLSAQAQASYLGFQCKERGLHLQPLLGLHYQQLNPSQFAEQGNSGAELKVNGSGYRSFRSEVGLGVNAEASHPLQPFAQVVWEHEFADTLSGFSAHFQNVNDTDFHIDSVEIGRETLASKLGLTANPEPHWTLSAFYEGRFAQHLKENAAKLQIGYVFL